ncbi:c-type cytochrome [Labrys neptuniae]|uniref:c-type cytochrome n=1 Tax=Labrys TaxID=204476 RepID=UPI00288D02A9|nr:c-type cytochrome [Labrys neptuniae]MDT3380052.1 c-type cytochrome [Labrys neptuniae]
MSKIVAAAMAALSIGMGANAAHAQAENPSQGQKLFQQRCGACHQVGTPRNGVGPTLQGLIGRKAGSVQGYNYSPALKASDVTWNAETLETFLANPSAMVRGTRMTQRFNSADERRIIVEFLGSHQ